MKLYHGFRNFENILSRNKLQCPSLQNFSDQPPLRYVSPSLLFAAGTSEILPYPSFNESELIIKYSKEIQNIAKENFSKELSIEEIIKYGLLFRNSIPTDSKEFYRTKGIYFSQTPYSSRDNFIVMNIPDKLIQYAPNQYPIVAGEISLDFATHLIVKNHYLAQIQNFLQETKSSIPIISYNNEEELLKLKE